MSTISTASQRGIKTQEDLSWWSRPLGRISRFINVYTWLAKDALWGKASRVVLVVVLSFLGASAVSATLVLLSIYLNQLETGQSWQVPMTSLELGAEMSSLWVVAGIILFLQFFSAIATYFCAVQSRSIARSYQFRAGSRVLQLVAGWHPIPGQTVFNRRYLGRTIKGDPRLMGKSTEAMVGSVQVMFYALAYVGILFYLDTGATIYVLPLFLISAPVLYFLGGRAHQASTEYYGRAREGIAGALKQYISVGEQWGINPDLRDDEIAQGYYTDPRIKAYWDYYDRRQLTAQRSELVTSLLRPVLIVVILLILGAAAIETPDSWGNILIYILALAQLSRSFGGLAGLLANLTDSYPRIRYYRGMYLPMENLKHNRQRPSSVDSIDIVMPGMKDFGGTAEVTLKAGKPTLYSTNRSFSRTSLAGVTEPLELASDVDPLTWYTCSFVVGRQSYPMLELRDVITGTKSPPPELVEDVDKILEDLKLDDEIAAFSKGDDTTLTQSAWAGFSPELRAAIVFLGVRSAPASLAIIELDVIEDLDPDFADQLIELLDHKIVLFLSSSNPRGDEVPADKFIWAVNDNILGMGDRAWWDSIKSRRVGMRKALKAQEAMAAMAMIGDDDDDEDM